MELSRFIDKYIEKTGRGMDMWSKEENAILWTVGEILEEDSEDVSSVSLNPHPRVDIKIKDIQKDEIGNFAECVIWNEDFKKVESSFFLDEDKAREIINLMENFIKKCKA